MERNIPKFMSNLESRVILLDPKDLNYPFSGKPSFPIKPFGAEYTENLYIGDLFPCYTHNRDLVLECAARCEKIFPIGFPITWYILPFEDDSRTNGYATVTRLYNSKKNKEAYQFSPYIVLWGKRISIHPAMSRYLCYHECGHQLDNWICYCRGYKDGASDFDKEYAEMRGIECYAGYGGLKHHLNIGEIIANDARICVFGAEREFWAHECEHPDKLPHVHEFWYKMMLTYGKG